MIYIANISNRLKSLFFATINRLEEEKKSAPPYRSPYYGGGVPNQHRFNLDNDDFYGVIYFYEWSDINRTPKTFYTLKAFENFLKTSDIFMAGFQKELIRNLHNPHIACKKNSKELLIKANYTALKSSLEIVDDAHKGSEDTPYNVQITRPPIQPQPKVINFGVFNPNLPKSMIQKPKVFEPEGRWNEDEYGMGGSWGW